MKFYIICLVVLKICFVVESQSCGIGYYIATASFISQDSVTEIGIGDASVSAARAAGFSDNTPITIVVDYNPNSIFNAALMLRIAKQYTSTNVLYYTLKSGIIGTSAKAFCVQTMTDMGQNIFDQTKLLVNNNFEGQTLRLIANERGVYAITTAAKLFTAADSSIIISEAISIDTKVPPNENNITPMEKGLARRVLSLFSPLGGSTIPNPDTADMKISTFENAKRVYFEVLTGASFPMKECVDEMQQRTYRCSTPSTALNFNTIHTLSGFFRIPRI